jgi:hypothetical protein
LAQPIVAAREPSFKQVNLKKYWKRCRWALIPRYPLTHRLERSHLLDAVRVEMLELQPILVQHPADKLTGGDGEAALVEGHE